MSPSQVVKVVFLVCFVAFTAFATCNVVTYCNSTETPTEHTIQD